MERVIKFKIWDKESEKWLNHCRADDLISPKDDFNQIFNNDNLVFCQYTGCRDIDGKEIYEFDVITLLKDEDSINPPKFTIIQKFGAWQICDLDYFDDVDSLPYFFNDNYGKDDSRFKVRVVGNLNK